jgi:hypothetical protein
MAMRGMALMAQYQRSPLEVLIARMNGAAWATALTDDQLQCAIAAAPYVHPRLQAIAVQEVPDVEREKRRDLLRRIPFPQRREIAAILEAARQQEESDVDAAIEGVSEEQNGEGS